MIILHFHLQPQFKMNYFIISHQCSIYYTNNELPNHFTLIVFWCERRDLLCSQSKGDIFTCEDNMLFSHVKTSSFRAKAHLAFYIIIGCYLFFCPTIKTSQETLFDWLIIQSLVWVTRQGFIVHSQYHFLAKCVKKQPCFRPVPWI